jgi:hypothetical protein
MKATVIEQHVLDTYAAPSLLALTTLGGVTQTRTYYVCGHK